MRHLWPKFREFDIDETLTSFETPVYKRLIWFEESAHNPPFEEPDLFNRTLVDAVKPFVTPGVKSEP